MDPREPDRAARPCAPGPQPRMADIEHYLRISERIPGWTRAEEAVELARASFSLDRRAVIVEIGSFLGSGTVLLAGPRKIRGSGLVHAVDPFDCSGDAFSVPYYEEIMKAAGGGSLRERFDENIRQAGLDQWVVAHEGRASAVAASWTLAVDLLFLDGDQSRSGAREAYASWLPFLRPGTIIALHNSSPNNHTPGHDGHRCLVEEEVHAPRYTDIRLVRGTTFARKT